MSNQTNFDPNAMRNPSTGLFARNPSHVRFAEESRDQQELVRKIRGQKSKIGRIEYLYDDIDTQDPPPLWGVTKIREMDEDSVVNFCKTLMRAKPNIIKLHLVLGNYTNKKRVLNNRTALLDANEPRFHTEVALKLAGVLNDASENVIEVIYTVNPSEGNFTALAEVYSVSDEDYENEELFSPGIMLEYIEAT